MDNQNGNSNRNRSRSPIRDRPVKRERRRSGSPERGRRRGGIQERRVHISNIPYEFRWQELKDLFRDEVGEVAFVEIFDSPKGTGIIEFNSPDLARKAIEKMHRFEVRGRKLVVKEETGDEPRRARSPRRSMNNEDRGGGGGSRWNSNNEQRSGSPEGWGFTYGLSPAFLESLDIKGPLVNRVFVANLDYKVDDKKLEEVFSLAGKLIRAEINKDRDGKSRGHGVVVYDHPVESVQAISMLHQQMLYDRSLIVRMDRVNDKPENNMPRLPDGLKGVGMGLGENGRPLTDVSRSIPMHIQNAQIQNMNMANPVNQMGGGSSMGPGPNMGMNMPNMQGGMTGMNFPNASGQMGNLNMLPNNLLASLNSGGLGTLLSALGQTGATPDLAVAMASAAGLAPNAGLGAAGGIGPTGGIGPVAAIGPNSGMGQAVGMGPTGGLASGAGLAGPAPTANLGGSAPSGIPGYSTGNVPAGSYSTGPQGSGSMNTAVTSSGFGGNSGNGSSGFGGSNSGGSNNDRYGRTSQSSGGGGGGYSSGGQTSYGGRSYDINSPYQGMDDNMEFRNQGYNTGQGRPNDGASPAKPESDTIVIRNLPPSVTWQHLRDKFREFGDVKFAEIRNKDTGFVRFNAHREAVRAMNAMNRACIEGRTIDVSLF